MFFRTPLLSLILVSSLFVNSVVADEPQEVKVVYPTQATEAVELDSSTPAKRVEPPTREDSEIDPVTPLGQIRTVLDTLARLETSQKSLETQIKKTPSIDENALSLRLSETLAQKNDVNNILTALQNGTEERVALFDKISEIKQTTENLRATVEAIKEATTSIEHIKDDKYTRYMLLAILCCFVLQLIGKTGSVISERIKKTVEKWENIAKAYETVKQQTQNDNK